MAWDMNRTLFANQRALGVEHLKRYAQDLRLDPTAFNECLDSNRHAETVRTSQQDGLRLGVSGTPSFFLNGQYVSGALPFEELQKLVERELAGFE